MLADIDRLLNCIALMGIRQGWATFQMGNAFRALGKHDKHYPEKPFLNDCKQCEQNLNLLVRA